MDNSSLLLTIAIPTYNRSRSLARLLQSLLSQLKNESRVELLISDNASPDETQATLGSYRLQGLVFRSIRNQINLGADGNIAQCFNEASGQYIWIIGDDDIVLPNGLMAVLDLLAADEYDIVHLRGRDIVEGNDTVHPDSLHRIEVIHDALTFTLKTHVFLTFITGNIINKRRVESLPHAPFSTLIGTSLVQLGWTYTALANFRKGACILDPTIAAGAAERGGYAVFTVFGTNLKRITETWLMEPSLVRIVLNGTLQVFFPRFALRSRLGDATFTEERPKALLQSLFRKNFRFYLFVYPILVGTPAFGHVWVLVCRIVNRIDKAAGNPMLR